MATADGRSWLEYLTPGECWRLLALSPVGRIGMIIEGSPEIYPVNHVVDAETILFRTDAGNKLVAIERFPTVCYQADGVNMDRQVGWSVLVKGRASVVDDPQELDRVRDLPLRFWAVGDKPYWIRIVPWEVTGRRIMPHTPDPPDDG